MSSNQSLNVDCFPVDRSRLMKLCKHITFFYNENLKGRLKYLNQVLQVTKTYDFETHIFIHTNKEGNFDLSLVDGETLCIEIIYHDLSEVHPYFLTWKSRDLMKKQKDIYDIFMYVEDDILVRNETIHYWLQHKNALLSRNFNLGFVRIETDQNKIEFATDIDEHFYEKTTIENREYVIDTGSKYCAMWILDKEEFSKFIDSDFYNLCNIHCITNPNMSREKSAWGLNDPGIKWYSNVLIPLQNGFLHPDSRIYHLPNNYIDHEVFASIRFENLVA